MAITMAMANTIGMAFFLSLSYFNCFLHAPIQMWTNPQNSTKFTIDRDGNKLKNISASKLSGVAKSNIIANSQTIPSMEIRELKTVKLSD